MSSYHGCQVTKKKKMSKSRRKAKRATNRRKDSRLDQYFESLGALAWLLQCMAVPGTRPAQTLLSIITGGPAAKTADGLGQWNGNAHQSRRLQFLARVTAACRCLLSTSPRSVDDVAWSPQYLRALLPSALGTQKTHLPHAASGFAWEYLLNWCTEDPVGVGLARTFVNRQRELDQCCKDATLEYLVNADGTAGIKTDKKLNYRILRARLPYTHSIILCSWIISRLIAGFKVQELSRPG